MRKLLGYFLLVVVLVTLVIPVSAIDLGIFRKLSIKLQQNEIGLTIRGVASQSANLLECQDSTGSSVFSVSAAGAATISGVTKAGIRKPADVYDATGTIAVTLAMSGKSIVATASGGNTTATLVDPTADSVGVVYEILQTADRNLIVNATTSNCNCFVADNGATSDQVSLATASHLIGGGIRIIGIQTGASTYKWFATAMSPTEPLTVEAAD